ncbi:Meiotic recombination protein REC8 [Merluccius polli]|uniref:Meiotic recombination protein REC8 n=1 Tax=Merluccius polli TaxID=89951 RepID=A0AA47MF27_MERPO|nr:Meiotic recombination protein REC8 [Merluccius polli]
MDYVLVRVPPPQPGLPRPRFSLYLSSQLQYGVVVVYHHQCVILLGRATHSEIQTTLDRLTKHKPAENINLDDKDGLPLCVPDALLLLTETEGAQEPFFGVMTVEATMPSPCTLIQFTLLVLGWHTAYFDLFCCITASPDSITLREKEPVTIPTAEFEGLELPDHDLDMIELLLAQEEDFPEEGPVAIAEREEDMARELARAEEDAERDRTKEITGSTIVLQPTMVSSEEAIQLPQEETGPPAARPPPHIGERVLVSEQQQLKRRGGGRRRRQLIFFDPDTQLNQEELQQRIGDPLTETQRPLLPPAPSHRMLPAAHLLTEPCNFLPEAIQLLWRQAATITPLSGLDLQVGERGVESTDSERDREAQREQDQQELQSVEVECLWLWWG